VGGCNGGRAHAGHGMITVWSQFARTFVFGGGCCEAPLERAGERRPGSAREPGHSVIGGWHYAPSAATITDGHPTKGVPPFVAGAPSGDPPWNASCRTIAHSEGTVLRWHSRQRYFLCCAENWPSGCIQWRDCEDSLMDSWAFPVKSFCENSQQTKRFPVGRQLFDWHMRPGWASVSSRRKRELVYATGGTDRLEACGVCGDKQTGALTRSKLKWALACHLD
jgi:hypothetical protein